MTTEIEKDFFETFEIEKKKLEHFDYKYYPDISDAILLRLVCIVPKNTLYGLTTVKQIKDAVLTQLTYAMKKYNAEELKEQVCHIFQNSTR